MFCLQGNAPAKAIFLISNLMILACIPFRIIGDVEHEEAILLFAVPGSWFLLMFFAGFVFFAIIPGVVNNFSLPIAAPSG